MTYQAFLNAVSIDKKQKELAEEKGLIYDDLYSPEVSSSDEASPPSLSSLQSPFSPPFLPS